MDHNRAPNLGSLDAGNHRQVLRILDCAPRCKASVSVSRMLASDTGTLQQAKLVLLGDMGAGKSSLVLRFVKGQFFDYQVGEGLAELVSCTAVWTACRGCSGRARTAAPLCSQSSNLSYLRCVILGIIQATLVPLFICRNRLSELPS